ncbi:MAG: glycoside hydrolase family 5 protein [SAR324 cluster bacterium]|uniref:Glycoside hydrolase family 5 protein n=1 Tax=SAR324 cluster bacterium TaxID=2024889 RepID=A0A7X9FQ22_9DELT|nr:glycoside hydrolase family 5 protein [SAR324 cluster bacterium]
MSVDVALASEPFRTAAFNLLPKKTINTEILGTNAFCNDPRFGTVKNQLLEVRDTLKLKHVRVLFAWNDQIQSSPTSKQNFSFYDDIARNIPEGVDAIVVLTGLPSWMKDPANWRDGNPRKTFNDLWIKSVTSRYAKNSRIIGYQIWNEPNDKGNPDNKVLNFTDYPQNYVELLAYSYSTIKKVNASKKVLTAATTAINQNFPRSINYNRKMKDAGALKYADIWSVHYYGEQIENVLRSKGFRSFSHGFPKPFWITESGEKGTNKQLSYGRRIWPFLTKYVRGIERIYQYQFTENTEASQTYGMRNLTKGKELSDLYIYLRDR